MRIDYNILWFEDVKESFNTKKEFVKDIVEEFGFNFPEPRNEVNGDNLDTINFNEYDLIIVDLNLSREKGPKLMERVRDLDVYTEVVFYSSDGEDAVRAALQDHQIDGAYCAGRANEDFEEKVRKVIQTTIKKVQSINNVRGLLMAETSDMDELMRDILLKYISKCSEENKQKLQNYICKSLQNSVNSNLKKISTLCANNELQGLINHRVFDADKMARTVTEVIGLLNHEQLNDLLSFCDVYRDQVLVKRNRFGHVKEKVIDGKKILQSHLVGEEPEEFTQELCKEIRNSLIQHRKNLMRIQEIIDGV